MIQKYCREYRVKNCVLLKDLSEYYGVKVGTLSAFELGNSSNIKHLNVYFGLSSLLCDQENFINGLINWGFENGF